MPVEDQVQAVVVAVLRRLQQNPRAFLRGLRDALGPTKWQQLRAWALAEYDADRAALQTQLDPPSAELPAGSLEEPAPPPPAPEP